MRGVVALPDDRSLRRRQVGQARVVGRVVDRRAAVERRTRGAAGEVVVVVGRVVAHAVGPAVVARLVQDVPLHAAVGPTGGADGAGVGTVVGDEEVVVLLVEADAERVAEAHGVDLGAGLLLGVGRLVEEVARGDRVATVGLRGDPEDLAVEVVGVGRRCAGRPTRCGRDARRSARSRRSRTGSCCHRWRGRGCRRCRTPSTPPAWQHSLRCVGTSRIVVAVSSCSVSPDIVKREMRSMDCRAGRRVVEVDPVVGGEVGVQRDAEQAELLAGVDRDRARGHARCRSA